MIKYDQLSEFLDVIGHNWNWLKAKMSISRGKHVGKDLGYASLPLTTAKKSCLRHKTSSIAGSDSTHDTALSC
jgi:hypothetical protein